MPGKNTGKKVTVTTPQGTTVTGDSRGDAGKYAAAKARKRAGEKSGDSPQKKGYMKGYTYSKPAEKLGYIQKFGAERKSPSKMGDEAAAKMLHGDAAAKYYDGVGKYMNGAAKYEGAAKHGLPHDDDKKEKLEVSVRGRQAESDKIVEKVAAEKLKQKVKDALPESGEHARQRSLARGATKGTFFGLEKFFD